MAPPPRKVSNLVSFFESGSTTPPPAPSSSSSTDTPDAPARPRPRASLPTPIPPTLARPERAASSLSVRSRDGAIPGGGDGIVSARVRRFSYDVTSTKLVAKGDPSAVESANREIVERNVGDQPERGRITDLDWTSRPRDHEQRRAEANVRIKAGEAKAKEKVETKKEESKASGSNSVEQKVSMEKEQTKGPTRKSVILDKFQPGRIAPRPPPQPVLIPANVSIQQDGKGRIVIKPPGDKGAVDSATRRHSKVADSRKEESTTTPAGRTVDNKPTNARGAIPSISTTSAPISFVSVSSLIPISDSPSVQSPTPSQPTSVSTPIAPDSRRRLEKEIIPSSTSSPEESNTLLVSNQDSKGHKSRRASPRPDLSSSTPPPLAPSQPRNLSSVHHKLQHNHPTSHTLPLPDTIISASHPLDNLPASTLSESAPQRPSPKPENKPSPRNDLDLFADPLSNSSTASPLISSSISPKPSPSRPSPLGQHSYPPVSFRNSPSEKGSDSPIPLTNLKGSTSQATLRSSSSSTAPLLAAEVFKKTADRLILPELDQYLDKVPSPKFSHVEGLLGEAERKLWNEWCSIPGKKRSWGFGGARKNGYVDLEKEEEDLLAGKEVGSSTSRDRSLIFPPMHLLPKNSTVADLKLNKGPAPLLTSSSALSSGINGILGIEGSTFGVSYETLESSRDLVQLVTLLSNSVANLSSASWFQAIFVTFPNILSLNFVGAFGGAILWLSVYTLIAAFCTYELWRFSGKWKGYQGEPKDQGEGFDNEGAFEKKGFLKAARSSRRYKMGITFILSTLYLPLSKVAVGAISWSSDFWTVENYYLFDDNPSPPLLGPQDQFYDPLDFCYKTSMATSNVNFAWIIVVVAVSTIFWLTLWLPWRLWSIVKKAAPKIDPFTELGEKRRDQMGEYKRLLERDRSAFSFLYQDYRREWAYFKTIYMGLKFVNILLLTLVTKDNCFFRSLPRATLSVIRQSTLLVFMLGFLSLSTISVPYNDLISNNSDRVSRISYVIIALLGLLVALNVQGSGALGGWVVITVDVCTYLLNGYFVLIGAQWAQRAVRRFERRLDFSIDVFSPNLDLPKHVARRVWQETFSVLLLTSPEFKMPKEEEILFIYEDHPVIPPYLLGFRGTQAERLVENVKIFRSIGLRAYYSAMLQSSLPTYSLECRIRDCLSTHYTGPDIVWHPLHPPYPPSSVTSYFGRLDVVPFPFLVIFRYDQNPETPVYLKDLEDLELLIRQNESSDVIDRRKTRVALRALEGQEVFFPFQKSMNLDGKGKVLLQASVEFQVGVLAIGRNSDVLWRGDNYSSGFQVTIRFNDGQGISQDGRRIYQQRTTIDQGEIGISDDFSLSSGLRKLFSYNYETIQKRLPIIEGQLQRHRQHFKEEMTWKSETLSYSFLLNVMAESDLSLDELDQVLKTQEQDERVRDLVESHKASMILLEERMAFVMGSRVLQFWYCLWDDIWRRNAGGISTMRQQPESFSPYYKESICYRVLSRGKLEKFLQDRGLGYNAGGESYFDVGMLNRIYFYLDEIVFSSTSRAIPIHLGTSHSAIPFESLSNRVPSRSPNKFDAMCAESTASPEVASSPLLPGEIIKMAHMLKEDDSRSFDTGGGTDHDDDGIRERVAFEWEEIYDQPELGPVRWNWEAIKSGELSERFRDWLNVRVAGGMLVWLGLRPHRHDHRPKFGMGVNLDLRRGQDGWELPGSRKEKEARLSSREDLDD